MKINPEALRALREKDGHSQASLARHSGITQSRISELEGDVPQMVRPSTAKRLADALAVPVSALVLVEVLP